MRKWGWLGLALALMALVLPPEEAENVSSASAGPGKKLIWIELDRKRLTVYENGLEKAAFPIASGAAGTPSPIGVFRVNRRFATELSGFGTRFLGLSVPWGQYGIHGTNKPESIGAAASHGCIRLRVKDAEKLYRMIPAGTRVVLEGGPYGPLNWGLRVLREGDRGADVMELQRRLAQRGYLGSADGVFGPSTRQAVLRARRDLSLPPGDQADAALQRKLGIMAFE